VDFVNGGGELPVHEVGDTLAVATVPWGASVGEVFLHTGSEFYLFAPLAYGASLSPGIAM
jgi:hypothetical protein